jgi:DNA-binding LytR/AlgR family response regulator
MKCYIIEDDKVQQEILKNYIKRTDGLTLIGVFDNVMNLQNLLFEESPDVLFLDVELPGKSGIDFVNQAVLPSNTNIIVVTSQKNYALDAFEINAVDYLLKPVKYERFQKSVDKVKKIMREVKVKETYFFVRTGGADVKIQFNDVLWIESAGEYVTIKTTGKKHMVYSNMNDMLKKLGPGFMRVHRSYIVNLDKVNSIHKNIVDIDGAHIRVSKTYVKKLAELILK